MIFVIYQKKNHVNISIKTKVAVAGVPCETLWDTLYVQSDPFDVRALCAKEFKFEPLSSIRMSPGEQSPPGDTLRGRGPPYRGEGLS